MSKRKLDSEKSGVDDLKSLSRDEFKNIIGQTCGYRFQIVMIDNERVEKYVPLYHDWTDL
jgi:hypothetical protein